MADTKLLEFIQSEQRAPLYVRDIANVIKENQLGLVDLNEIVTIIEGVDGKTEYAYYGSVEGVTRKDTGCGMNAKVIDVPVRSGMWDPKPLKVSIKMCYKELLKSFLVWTMKKGIDRQDISDGTYAMFITDIVQDAIKNDFTRLVVFGNENHSVKGTGSGTEVLAAGVDAANYMLINGLFTQFEKMATTDATKRYTIEENAEASFAAQRALKADTAYKAFMYMLDNADGKTFAIGSTPIIFCTYTLAKNLTRYMREHFPNGSEGNFTLVQSGYEVAEFEGVKIVTHRWTDMLLQRDFKDAAKFNNPHRALLLDKSECQVGIDSLASLENLQLEYVGGEDENVYLKAAYSADFQRVIGTTGAVAW